MTALPPDAGRPELRSMYLLVLVVLSITLLGCIAAWIALALMEKSMPDGLSALTTLIADGLLGVLAPTPSTAPPR